MMSIVDACAHDLIIMCMTGNSNSFNGIETDVVTSLMNRMTYLASSFNYFQTDGKVTCVLLFWCPISGLLELRNCGDWPARNTSPTLDHRLEMKTRVSFK